MTVYWERRKLALHLLESYRFRAKKRNSDSHQASRASRKILEDGVFRNSRLEEGGRKAYGISQKR